MEEIDQINRPSNIKFPDDLPGMFENLNVKYVWGWVFQLYFSFNCGVGFRICPRVSDDTGIYQFKTF